MSEEKARYILQFQLAARILAESCESCLQREFDYVCDYGTFICESCAVVQP